MKKLLVLLAFTSLINQKGFNQTSQQNIQAHPLTEWMDFHCRLLRNAKGIAHVAYARHFSYTAIAAYESIIAGNTAYRSLANQLNGLSSLPSPPKGKISWHASLNAAYAQMLHHFYSSFEGCTAAIDSMETVQKKKLLQTSEDGLTLNNSAAYGIAIADHILDWAKKDGADNSKTYIPLNNEERWRPTTTAAAPFWSENRTMTRNLFSVYALIPPVYSGDTVSAFYKIANEVYNVSQRLTPEQKTIALYWDDSPNGKYMTAFGHWTSILFGLIKQHDLTPVKAAEAFAKMSVAMHEASILAWKGKYQYNIVRPITYIQKHIDKNWNPLIPTPPHPEFPAAHATLSNAAAAALRSTFGDSCSLTDRSYIDMGMKERVYSSIQDAAKEAGLSRLYGGIHYRYSIEQGFVLGEAAARFVERSVIFHSPH